MPATSSSRHAGTGMPAFAASVRATASHRTVLISSPLCGNFAIARWPSRSRTEALGRAPPSDEPGASSRRRSSSLSVSLATCSAAESSRGSSISGGIVVAPSSARNGPPFPLGEAQRALARFVVHHEQVVDFPQRARRLALALRAPALGAAHQDASPAIGRGVADGAEQRFVGWRVKRAGAELQGRFERETVGMREPALVVLEGGALPVLAHARPQPPHQMGRAFAGPRIRRRSSPSLLLDLSARTASSCRGRRMRCGRCSSSSARPTASCLGSARSASRSAIPRTKSTVA